MKSMFDHMITMLVMVILLFVFSTIMMTEMQIMTARKVHSSVINQYQSSYYTVNIDEINKKIQAEYPDWVITVKKLASVNTRQDAEITLNYKVNVPIFNISKDGVIKGYTR